MDDFSKQYFQLSDRMNKTMDAAIDRVARGETLSEVTLEREPNEVGHASDLLYIHLLERLLTSGVRARWSGTENTSGITVNFSQPPEVTAPTIVS